MSVVVPMQGGSEAYVGTTVSRCRLPLEQPVVIKGEPRKSIPPVQIDTSSPLASCFVIFVELEVRILHLQFLGSYLVPLRAQIPYHTLHLTVVKHQEKVAPIRTQQRHFLVTGKFSFFAASYLQKSFLC
jgi:hypothetical protein